MVRVITFLWRLIWITAAILAAILAGLALYFTTTRLAMGHIPDAGVFVTQLGSYLMSLMAERPAHALLTLGFVAAAVGTLEYAGMRSGITYGAAAAACHLARTVCRRAEREIVSLSRAEAVSSDLLRYINRLSDLLFVLCRVLARAAGEGEVLWRSDKRRRGRGE